MNTIITKVDKLTDNIDQVVIKNYGRFILPENLSV